jgi:predicted nucleic acid-binding protein
VKLVIDANIGLKAMLPEHDSAKAIQLRDDFRKGIHDLLAPDLYLLEAGNTLVTSARSGKIPMNDLPVFFAELMANQPIIYPSTSLFPRAYDIASQSRVSVYDATYVALAEREGCDLVTADDKLLKALPGLPIVSLASL